jgi:vacuolar-type H+-ATPase subunit F/Vma7
LKCIYQVPLSGQTFFERIIKNSREIAVNSFKSSRTYTILLILTDGEIDDLQDTIDHIVETSNSPLSIVIVGIGSANFSAMDKLDADVHPLRSRGGHLMQRDIVQFVPFCDFANRDPSALAAEVLAEIPDQAIEFCKSAGFTPNAN